MFARITNSISIARMFMYRFLPIVSYFVKANTVFVFHYESAIGQSNKSTALRYKVDTLKLLIKWNVGNQAKIIKFYFH